MTYWKGSERYKIHLTTCMRESNKTYSVLQVCMPRCRLRETATGAIRALSMGLNTSQYERKGLLILQKLDSFLNLISLARRTEWVIRPLTNTPASRVAFCFATCYFGVLSSLKIVLHIIQINEIMWRCTCDNL